MACVVSSFALTMNFRPLIRSARPLRHLVWLLVVALAPLSLAQIYPGGASLASRTVVSAEEVALWGESPTAEYLWWEWVAPANGKASISARSQVSNGVTTYYLPTIDVYVLASGTTAPLPGTESGTSSFTRTVSFEAVAGSSYIVRLSRPRVAGGMTMGKIAYPTPPGFNWAEYIALNSDLRSYFEENNAGAWVHFYNYGIAEGRAFSPDFIPEEYRELHADLQRTLDAGDRRALVMHWLQWGRAEGRLGRVPRGFNVDRYLSNYADLNAAFGGITPRAARNVAVWNHYLEYGVLEGRTDGDFHADAYLAENADLANALGNDVLAATLHWYYYGRKEGRRIPPGFNVVAYRGWNQDVDMLCGADNYGAWEHYRDTGVYEGRHFDNAFRPEEYLALNPDLQAAFGSDPRAAAIHWVYYGKREGRAGRF
jgi:hypothetical protein